MIELRFQGPRARELAFRALDRLHGDLDASEAGVLVLRTSERSLSALLDVVDAALDVVDAARDSAAMLGEVA